MRILQRLRNSFWGLVKPRITEIGLQDLEKYAGRVDELEGKLVVRLSSRAG